MFSTSKVLHYVYGIDNYIVTIEHARLYNHRIIKNLKLSRD